MTAILENNPGKKAEASRRNGARGKGPVSEAGRRRSATAAVKHGLRARTVVLLSDEDPVEFAAFDEALSHEMAPEGPLQVLLARRVVVAAWRMLRCDRMERDLFATQAGPAAGGGSSVDLGMALIRDGHGPKAFERLLRYRGSALAEFWRSLAALKALQGQGAALPPLLALPDTKRTRESLQNQRPRVSNPEENYSSSMNSAYSASIASSQSATAFSSLISQVSPYWSLNQSFIPAVASWKACFSSGVGT